MNLIKCISYRQRHNVSSKHHSTQWSRCVTSRPMNKTAFNLPHVDLCFIFKILLESGSRFIRLMRLFPIYNLANIVLTGRRKDIVSLVFYIPATFFFWFDLDSSFESSRVTRFCWTRIDVRFSSSRVDDIFFFDRDLVDFKCFKWL